MTRKTTHDPCHTLAPEHELGLLGSVLLVRDLGLVREVTAQEVIPEEADGLEHALQVTLAHSAAEEQHQRLAGDRRATERRVKPITNI